MPVFLRVSKKNGWRRGGSSGKRAQKNGQVIHLPGDVNVQGPFFF